VRMDSHLYPDYLVPPNYDSLLGKLIVWGADREQVRGRSQFCRLCMDRRIAKIVLVIASIGASEPSLANNRSCPHNTGHRNSTPALAASCTSVCDQHCYTRCH
jgi:hypothetical protein